MLLFFFHFLINQNLNLCVWEQSCTVWRMMILTHSVSFPTLISYLLLSPFFLWFFPSLSLTTVFVSFSISLFNPANPHCYLFPPLAPTLTTTSFLLPQLTPVPSFTLVVLSTSFSATKCPNRSRFRVSSFYPGSFVSVSVQSA